MPWIGSRTADTGGGGSSGASTELVLARTEVTTGGNRTVSNHASFASIDSAFAVAFTVPANGEVEIRAEISWSGTLFVALHDGSALVSGSGRRVNNISAASGRAVVSWLLTGLTPHASGTYTLYGQKAASGSTNGTIYVDAGTATDDPLGPFIMEARATEVVGSDEFFPARMVTTATRAALQTTLDAAGTAGGGLVVVPENTTIDLDAQVSIPSEVTLYLSEGALLERSWSSTNVDKQVSATIINANAPTWDTFLSSDPYTPGTLDTGIRILGPGKIGVSSALRTTVDGDTNQRTPVIYMVGVDGFVLDDVTLDTGGRDWTVTIYGDRARIGDNVKIVGGEYVFEDGIHVMGGTGGRIGRCHVESGDDAIAFGSNYDNPISDWTVDHPYVVSQRGNALSFIRAREGDTSGSGAFTTDVEHVRVRGLSGRSGLLRNGVMVVKEDAASAGTIHDIDVELDVEMGESATHDGTNDQALHILGGSGRIRAHVRNPLVQALYVDRAATWDIDLTTDAGPQTTTARAVQVVAATDLTLNGRIVAPSAMYAVQIASCPLTHFGTLTIVDAPSGIAAVRMMTAGNVLTASRLRIDKASGASDARGVEFAAAASAEILEFRADVNRPFSNAGTAASIRARAILPERERTIASGAINVQGEEVVHVLSRTTGSPDTLATISNGYVGQEIEVRNGEASPGTATITLSTAGNIGVPSSRVIDAAGKGVRLRWNGTEWAELANFT